MCQLFCVLNSISSLYFHFDISNLISKVYCNSESINHEAVWPRVATCRASRLGLSRLLSACAAAQKAADFPLLPFSGLAVDGGDGGGGVTETHLVVLSSSATDS